MAGTKVNNYSNVDTNIQALQLTTDKVFKGLHQLTLTEMDTTTVPAIAAGSVVECNGTLIKYDTEEAIVTTDPHTSATVADGAVYIVIKGSDLTAYFTATAPTWSDAKQGYYGTTTWANDRYVGNCIKASTSYTYKYYIKDQEIKHTKSIVKVSKGNAQTISIGSSVIKITFVTEIYDINNEFASSTFTAKQSGYYLIQTQVSMHASAADTEVRTIYLYLNGANVMRGSTDPALDTSERLFFINTILFLNAGDYIEFYGKQSTTSLTPIAMNYTFLSIIGL